MNKHYFKSDVRAFYSLMNLENQYSLEFRGNGEVSFFAIYPRFGDDLFCSNQNVSEIWNNTQDHRHLKAQYVYPPIFIVYDPQLHPHESRHLDYLVAFFDNKISAESFKRNKCGEWAYIVTEEMNKPLLSGYD